MSGRPQSEVWNRSGYFDLGALAARAEVKLLLLAVDDNRDGMDVGERPRVRAPL